MSDNWYQEYAPSHALTQGDIILDCPVIGWKSEEIDFSGQGLEEVLDIHSEILIEDVVVMTQACDLEENKVHSVIVCPHFPITEFKAAWEEDMMNSSQNPTGKAWDKHYESIRKGHLWNLSILNDGKTESLSTLHRVVDFHDIYSVPRPVLDAAIERQGTARMSLRPPYREHLSQAFARFFMRVGFPLPISKLPE